MPGMSDGALRTTIHARITPDVESGYVATCEEMAVVTQGETLDEVTANLRDAVAPFVITHFALDPDIWHRARAGWVQRLSEHPALRVRYGQIYAQV